MYPHTNEQKRPAMNASTACRVQKSIIRSDLSLLLVVLAAFSFLAGGVFLEWEPFSANFGKWKKCLELLTGFWLLFAMMGCVLSGIRNPRVDEFFRGLPNALRSHRTLGIWVCVLLALHWVAAKGPKWAAQLGLIEAVAKKRGPTADPQWWDAIFKFLKDSGEWLGYVMILLLVLALFGRFLRHNSWIKLHRVFGLITFAGILHGIGSFPSNLMGSWPQWLCVLLLIPGYLLLRSQLKLDFKRPFKGTVCEARKLDEDVISVTVQTDEKPAIQPGQFVFLSFDAKEYPHPFSVVRTELTSQGCLFTVWIKAEGPYTRLLMNRDLKGACAYWKGPYGQFLDPLGPSPRTWIAGGIGISPFVSLLAGKKYKDTNLVWCVRSASSEWKKEVEGLALAAGVPLKVIESSKKERLGQSVAFTSVMTPESAFNAAFCGPAPLRKSLDSFLKRIGAPEAETEYFNWR